MLFSFLGQQPLDLGSETRRDIVASERVCDVCGEKADLRAAIEGAAFELQAIQGLRLRQSDHRVGDLDFAARTLLLGREDVEDLRLQNIASGYDEIRRRLVTRWLLDHSGNAEGLALRRTDADDAVHV